MTRRGTWGYGRISVALYSSFHLMIFLQQCSVIRVRRLLLSSDNSFRASFGVRTFQYILVGTFTQFSLKHMYASRNCT